LWYCFHGYGELAGRHIDQFADIAGDGRVIIAPEALSRFYTEGTSGRIGASWMTTEDREAEIRDYIGYLDGLRSSFIRRRTPAQPPREVISGFSQGTATASRWAAASDHCFDTMILWGGTVAHDITEQGVERIRQIRRRVIVFGDSDRYASEERIVKEMSLLDDRRIPFELIRFNGGHRVDRQTLAGIAASE
jgi:predicted esterase